MWCMVGAGPAYSQRCNKRANVKKPRIGKYPPGRDRKTAEGLLPIWDKMTYDEKYWYTVFILATEYHGWGELRWLCDLAPNANFERLKVELTYEMEAPRRNTFTMPAKNSPSYSEWDYGWEQPEIVIYPNFDWDLLRPTREIANILREAGNVK